MGCGSSTSNSTVSTNRPSRPANTTSVAVQRPGVLARPLTKPKNYRHGSPLTQVGGLNQIYEGVFNIYLLFLYLFFYCCYFLIQRDLNNMRESFWSSRTEGNTHMWQNIRSIAEALASNDLMLANAILEVCILH